MQVQHIHLSEIDSINQYCYHIDLDVPELQGSIRMWGIQTPLWLIRSDKPVIVDGYRRFRIAQDLGISKIPVVLFDENEFESLFLLVLSLNSSISKLTIIEKIKVLKISDKFLSLSLNDKVMEILDLSFIRSADEILDILNKVPSWLQGYLHRIDISLKSLKKLTTYPFEKYDYWFKIANTLHFKGGELIRMLEMIHEICMRDGISPIEIWDQLSMEQRIAENMTPQQISLVIKNELYRARFPHLSQINQNIREKVNQLKKNHEGNLDIYWDQLLEDSSLKFSFTFSESEAIDDISSFIENPQTHTIIKDIFNQMVQLPAKKK